VTKARESQDSRAFVVLGAYRSRLPRSRGRAGRRRARRSRPASGAGRSRPLPRSALRADRLWPPPVPALRDSRSLPAGVKRAIARVRARGRTRAACARRRAGRCRVWPGQGPGRPCFLRAVLPHCNCVPRSDADVHVPRAIRPAARSRELPVPLLTDHDGHLGVRSVWRPWGGR